MTARNSLLAAVLAAAVALSILWPMLPMPPSLLDQVPSSAPGIASRDVPLTETEIRWLGHARGIKRIVRSPSGLWLLAVTDGSLNRQAVHDPAYCFRGEGWTVTGRETLALPDGRAVLLTLEKAGQFSQALAWFSDGGAPFASTVEYWARTTLRRLTLGLSGNEPLLFILRPLGAVPSDWAAIAPGLIGELTPQANM